MKCPHCQTAVHPSLNTNNIGMVGKIDGTTCLWAIEAYECPECKRPVLSLVEVRLDWSKLPESWSESVPMSFYPDESKRYSVIFPRGANRPPAPPEVPRGIAADFNEACVVLADSPKASAALSRRCLQHVLRERKVSTKRDLSQAIDDALSAHLPAHIADNLDAIRNIGNFAAHPQKSVNSGEILDVEPGEAEWNLDVLESLFDHYYVQPTKSAARREALDKKLAEARKKPMKRP